LSRVRKIYVFKPSNIFPVKERGFRDLPVGRWLGAEVEVTTQGAGRETIGLEKEETESKVKIFEITITGISYKRIVGISDKSRS
jgi:hypothetical protein